MAHLPQPKLVLPFAALLAGALAAFAWRGAEVLAAPAAPAAPCTQWQTAVHPDAIDVKAPLPEAGKPIVSTGPVGWEPFAFGPSGQLVYRRCVK
jgi:hypothetical protein